MTVVSHLISSVVLIQWSGNIYFEAPSSLLLVQFIVKRQKILDCKKECHKPAKSNLSFCSCKRQVPKSNNLLTFSAIGQQTEQWLTLLLIVYYALLQKVTHNSIGAQGRLTKNTPQQHINYFQLKLLEKELMQEEHSGLPVSLPSKQEINLFCGRCPL